MAFNSRGRRARGLAFVVAKPSSHLDLIVFKGRLAIPAWWWTRSTATVFTVISLIIITFPFSSVSLVTLLAVSGSAESFERPPSLHDPGSRPSALGPMGQDFQRLPRHGLTRMDQRRPALAALRYHCNRKTPNRRLSKTSQKDAFPRDCDPGPQSRRISVSGPSSDVNGSERMRFHN